MSDAIQDNGTHNTIVCLDAPVPVGMCCYVSAPIFLFCSTLLHFEKLKQLQNYLGKKFDSLIVSSQRVVLLFAFPIHCLLDALT